LLARLHQLLIEVGIVEVLAMLGVGKPHDFASARSFVYAGDVPSGSRYGWGAALGKNVDAFVLTGARVTVYSPETAYSHIVLAAYRKA